MARVGAGVIWMFGSIVALAACGGAKASAPAPDPVPSNVAVPVRSTPAPAITWQDGGFHTDRLPAAARGGEVAVVAVRDNDGGRGYPSLRIEVRDRSDKLIQTIPVMTANEFEALAPGGKPGAMLARRIADANHALATLHGLHDLVEMHALEVQKPTNTPAHLAMADDIDVDFGGDHVDVLIHDSERVLAHRATGSWEVAPSKDCAKCEMCEHPAYLGNAYHATGIDLVVVDVAYMGTDTCWEPSDQLHVVAW